MWINSLDPNDSYSHLQMGHFSGMRLVDLHKFSLLVHDGAQIYIQSIWLQTSPQYYSYISLCMQISFSMQIIVLSTYEKLENFLW